MNWMKKTQILWPTFANYGKLEIVQENSLTTNSIPHKFHVIWIRNLSRISGCQSRSWQLRIYAEVTHNSSLLFVNSVKTFYSELRFPALLLPLKFLLSFLKSFTCPHQTFSKIAQKVIFNYVVLCHIQFLEYCFITNEMYCAVIPRHRLESFRQATFQTQDF